MERTNALDYHLVMQKLIIIGDYVRYGIGEVVQLIYKQVYSLILHLKN